MATLVRQMYRHHSLLNGTKQLGRQSIKTWTYSLEQLDVPLLSPYRKCFQPVLKKLFVKHIKFCSSSAEPTQRPENKSLSFADKLKSEDHYFNIEEDYPSGISRLTKALPEEKTALENLEEEDWEEDLSSSALEEVSEEEAIRILATPPLPSESFTLKDYVDHSETLRQLVLLGVDLSKVEKRRGAGQLLLKLDFEKDIKKTLFFLKDVGLKDDQLGAFLTKNPYIFREDVEDLQTRITYLTAKNFSKEEIAQMVARAPYLLLFSVERLDNRLGFFQKELGLNTQKTRDLVIRLPRILTGGLENIKENLKVFELELGFNRNEIRHILYKVPRNLDARKRKLTTIFDYLHNTMGIPHKLFVHFPQVFNSRLLRFKERHMFLEFLGKAQYDPEQPNYVSLDKLASLPNNAFCADIAKVKLEDFQKFLKTL